MKPHSLSIIILLLSVNILLSKHYLIEVQDDEKKQGGPVDVPEDKNEYEYEYTSIEDEGIQNFTGYRLVGARSKG